MDLLVSSPSLKPGALHRLSPLHDENSLTVLGKMFEKTHGSHYSSLETRLEKGTFDF